MSSLLQSQGPALWHLLGQLPLVYLLPECVAGVMAAVSLCSLCFVGHASKDLFTIIVVGVKGNENRCECSTCHLYKGLTPALLIFSNTF